MSDTADHVSMEFQGPVPGIIGAADGYHVVFWVQAGGGASFTRPSADELAYYAEVGKVAPEWQCEYFEFDGVSWVEAALSIELWRGKSKLRSLFASALTARTEEELRKELPDLDRFIDKHGLTCSDLKASFHEALLHAAETAKVIQRGVVNATPRSSAASQVLSVEDSWLRRTLRRLLPRRRSV